jgi:hypothetical protein
MARPDRKAIVQAAKSYLKDHPEEILRALKGLLGLRMGVPLDALRYLARELAGGKKAPKDIVLDPAPPGLRAQMTVDAMGTPIRATLVATVEEIHITTDEVKFVVRISDLALKVLDDAATSPVAALIKSGALDLSKPGNLVNFIPKRPAMLVDAKDDKITLDLMKLPKLAENPRLKKILAVAVPVVGLRAIRTRDDHLDLHFRATLGGVPEAVAAARA